MTPKLQQAASLQDFCNFHGMLCYPRRASGCIDQFTGSLLFMPSDYAKKPLGSYECVNVLNLVSYYTLVLLSFTGLLTALRQTKFLVGRDEGDVQVPTFLSAEMAGKKHGVELQIESKQILQHVQELFPDSKSLRLRRRFEYDFGPLLSVVMLHLTCNQGRLHLLEIYHVHNPLLRGVFGMVLPALRSVWRTVLGLPKAQ
jgi:hypothetical protein